MIMMKWLTTLLCIFMCSLDGISKTFHDSPHINLSKWFSEVGAKYVISHCHTFKDTLILPSDCELYFDGGSLSGPIVMNHTKLSGIVNLKGSSLNGKVDNKRFDASWLCFIDGVTDDAQNINQMIDVCGNVFFPKGEYRLASAYDPTGKVSKKLYKSIKSHIGICKSNVTLTGEKGTRFVTTDTLGTICAFSQPYKIDKSISNILIKNISFNVHNDGVHFHEQLHTIKTIGVNGITIEECSFIDFWGDAICLSHYGDNPRTGERTRNQNVRIRNNMIIGGIHHNNRNGISVISGKNVLVNNNVIKNTSRRDMPGGIDVEPNNSAFTMENIRIENNYLEGITGSGGAINLFIGIKKASAHHIEILSNKIKSCSRGIRIVIKTKATTDNIILKDNHVHADTDPYLFRGRGISKDWIIEGNAFDKPCQQKIPGEIIIENLKISSNRNGNRTYNNYPHV